MSKLIYYEGKIFLKNQYGKKLFKWLIIPRFSHYFDFMVRNYCCYFYIALGVLYKKNENISFSGCETQKSVIIFSIVVR
jgi:hypothetical protein